MKPSKEVGNEVIEPGGRPTKAMSVGLICVVAIESLWITWLVDKPRQNFAIVAICIAIYVVRVMRFP